MPMPSPWKRSIGWHPRERPGRRRPSRVGPYAVLDRRHRVAGGARRRTASATRAGCHADSTAIAATRASSAIAARASAAVSCSTIRPSAERSTPFRAASASSTPETSSAHAAESQNPCRHSKCRSRSPATPNVDLEHAEPTLGKHDRRLGPGIPHVARTRHGHHGRHRHRAIVARHTQQTADRPPVACLERDLDRAHTERLGKPCDDARLE